MKLFLLVMSLLLCFGCSTLQQDAPRVYLSDLQVTDVTVFETIVQVRMRVANRSPQPLEIRGGRFELSVNDFELGEGLSGESLTIPALDSREITVPFQLSNLSFIRRFQRLMESERFEYSISGKLFRPGFGSYSVEEKNLVWEPIERRLTAPPSGDRYGTL